MNESNEQHADEAAQPRGTCGRRRRARVVIGAVALIAIGAVGGAMVAAASGAAAHSGWRGGWSSSATSPEAVRERLLDASAWALGRVDASDEQREKIDAVLARVAERVVPLRESHREHRRDLVAELARPEVSPEALERIRREELALAEEASREIVGALAEIAQVLDPEQRQTLLERFARKRR